jgi:hypothetical protein
VTDLPQLREQLEAAAARRRPVRVPVVAAVVLLVLGVGGLTVRFGGGHEVAVAPPHGRPRTAEEAFAVLRRPARRSDALRARLPRPGPERTGSVRRSRRLGRIGAERFYLVETSRDVLCLVARSARGLGSVGCGPSRTYLDGRRPQGSFSDEAGPSDFAMVFADGVADVRLTLADGTRLRPRLRNNAILARVPSRVTTMTWRAPDGSRRTGHFQAAPAERASDYYAVLQRRARPGDAVPGLSGARQAAPGVWIGQAGDELCLRYAHTTACHAKVADVRRALVIVTPRRERLVAAIPDAIHRIGVVYADGRVQRRAVQGNVLVLDARDIVSLNYHVDATRVIPQHDRVARRSDVTVINGEALGVGRTPGQRERPPTHATPTRSASVTP